ncbi:hypothetical protein [Isoptericola sp. QY 916]|uniref:hypothetical protein n=1 Tax=Isoptericola sp. QY 916 TaxID=2782570 RepID=UPI003D2FC960|nr:hypothetical protein [Isoptericola sp. QY 916]
MTSPAAVLDLIRRELPAQARYAIVTAVTSSPVTVTVRFVEGGNTFQPDVLNLTTLPTVGARALILPVSGRWVFAGVPASPTAVVQYHTLVRRPVHNWFKSHRLSDGGWYQMDQIGHEYPNLRTNVTQGLWPPQAGGLGNVEPVNPPLTEWMSVLDHNARPGLDAIAAASGTVQMVELVLTRTLYAGGDYVSPVIWGHLYDGANPPPAGGPPAWVPGYGPVRLAPFAAGQTARWVLPVSWLTGLATGAIKGIGFRDSTTTGQFDSATPDGENAQLVITYTAPTEVIL